MRTVQLRLVLGEPYLLHGSPASISGFPEGVKVELTLADTGQKLLYARSELALLAMRGALRSMTDPQDPSPTQQPLLDLGALPAEERAKGERCLAYAKALIPYVPVSPKSAVFRKVIEVVAERLADPVPPSPHSVYRWLRTYITSGHNADVFFGEARISHQRRSGLNLDLREALEQKLMDALGSNPGATLYGAYDHVMAQLAQEHGFDAYRTIEGKPALARGPIPQIITHDAARKPRKSTMRKSARQKAERIKT